MLEAIDKSWDYQAIKNRLGGMIGQMNGLFSKIEGPAENGNQTRLDCFSPLSDE